MTRLLPALAFLALLGSASASEPMPKRGGPAFPGVSIANVPTSTDTTGVAADPAESRQLGAAWLKKTQQNSGGWAAGVWGEATSDAQADTATTAFVTLSLLRDAKGTRIHDEAIARGVDYVLTSIETAPADSPRLNTPEGTQIQYKLGTLVDTHLASLLLGEVYGKMGPERNRRIGKAYSTVLRKVEMAQQADGSFDSNGWAPVLSSSIASQGLYRAAENGQSVDAAVLDRADQYSAQQVSATGSADASAGAGVALYGVATALAGNTKAKRRAGSTAAPAAEEKAEAMAQQVAGDTGALVAGFGSIGGEEMLSYMMISDSLASDGGERWDDWDKQIGDYLVQIQNQDGSWVGHHCITSPVFVTAGALSTLAARDFADQKQQRSDAATGS
ncbi:MAG: hypothetical protein KC912_00195 [Proteobacteria bacterium]|nr:hypothetical protein [Pseudomonadota bacterium]